MSTRFILGHKGSALWDNELYLRGITSAKVWDFKDSKFMNSASLSSWQIWYWCGFDGILGMLPQFLSLGAHAGDCPYNGSIVPWGVIDISALCVVRDLFHGSVFHHQPLEHCSPEIPAQTFLTLVAVFPLVMSLMTMTLPQTGHSGFPHMPLT